jgi:endonuclease V-like protein UPF0215 family
MEIIDKVIEAMSTANKPLKTSEVAELAGIDKKDAEKVIKKLSSEGRVYSPVRCFWQMK